MSQDTPPSAPPPVSRFPGRVVILLLLLVVCIAAYAVFDAYSFLHTPAAVKAGREPQEVIIDIQPGATFDRVAWDLRKLGAVSDVPRFRILAEWRGKLGSVQAGEFAVNTGWTPEKILEYITSGNQRLYKLAVREGLPWWEVARLVEEGGFATAKEFETVIHDPEFLRRNGIPFANAEGFLYPETYLLRKPREMQGRKQAEAVARVLIETFWKRSWPALAQYAAANTPPGATPGTPLALPDFTLRDNLPVRTPPPIPSKQAPPEQTDPAAQNGAGQAAIRESPIPEPLRAPVSRETLQYLMTLASLVEKETGVPEERARVAGVYANRLRLGMLLQCDPTIIYGLGPQQKGPIRRSQLEDENNIYNTYKHPGLPPGPICSPGAAAMRAAAGPDRHGYLYFVATGRPDGTHTFSTNIVDHNKAVREFRRTQR